MDRSTNPMVVNSLVVLGEVPDREAVVAILRERLVERSPRFRQRVVDALGRWPALRTIRASTSRTICTGGRCPQRATEGPWRS